MIRLGILGAENSHASAFIDLFNNRKIKDGVKVIAIGGKVKDMSRKVFEDYKLEKLIDDPEEMTNYVDAAMITARDGKYHAELALPFIKKGMPVFIDKPFTVSVSDAEMLAEEAKKSGALISGGSSVKSAYDVLMLKNIVESNPAKIKGGSVTAPLSMHNDYSGFYFYSSHLAEMSMNIFGFNPKSVTAKENNGSVTAIIDYGNFSVSNHFMNDCGAYSAAVYTPERNFLREVDISLCYKHECDEFIDMIINKRMPRPFSQLTAPVIYLNAIEKSYKENKTVELKF